MKRRLILSLSLFLWLLAGCAEKKEFTGKAALLEEDIHGRRVLVVQEISDKVLQEGPIEKILEIASRTGENGNSNGMFFYIDEDTFQKLKTGQTVTATYRGPAQEALPPKVGADKVEVTAE
ncbi:DUF3221 domain-containing protein [Domibacillus indicus]|uniref:DUF3221 domain-containing protein n=1 Tax=Domibacillus indicus TaxID=1437523 RepID=UPI000617D3C0|nr:DUF3221 domain-containing protein [Domibacillus indicus]